MKVQIVLTVILFAICQYCVADQDFEKIQLLDAKFRTKFAKQPSAFNFNNLNDGVELGCYGYIKDGTPVRVYYVYDIKDYRWITTTMKFLVHPDSHKKRFAILTPIGKQDREKKLPPDVLRFPHECL